MCAIGRGEQSAVGGAVSLLLYVFTRTLYLQCVLFDPLVLSRFEGNHHQVRLMTNELQLNPQQLLIVHLLGQICMSLHIKWNPLNIAPVVKPRFNHLNSDKVLTFESRVFGMKTKIFLFVYLHLHWCPWFPLIHCDLHYIIIIWTCDYECTMVTF